MPTITLELEPAAFPPEFFRVLDFFMPDVIYQSVPASDPGKEAWQFSCPDPTHFYPLGWLHAQFRREGLEQLRAGAEAQGFDLSLVETALQAEKEAQP